MTSRAHSFGPTCKYYDEEHEDRSTNANGPPPVKAQFFYISSLPIDDPLSPLPPISAEKANKQPPQPFSARDNAALEEAWQGLKEKDDGHVQGGTTTKPAKTHNTEPPRNRLDGTRYEMPLSGPSGDSHKERTAEMATRTQSRPIEKFRRFLSRERGRDGGHISDDSEQSKQEKTGTQASTPDHTQRFGSPGAMLVQGSHAATAGRALVANREVRPVELSSSQPLSSGDAKRKRQFSPSRNREKSPPKRSLISKSLDNSGSESVLGTSQSSQNTYAQASDISGRPFARAPSQRNVRSSFGQADATFDTEPFDEDHSPQSSHRSSTADVSKTTSVPRRLVPVGISRLHLVEMPDLMMKPIYWSPINDTSNVIRATWFYKDTMLPIPVEVANRLEIGYEDMRPYAPAYQEELQACVENGPAAELKIVHRLWNDDLAPSMPTSTVDGKTTNEMTAENEEDPPAVPSRSENMAVDNRKRSKKRQFESYSVIYVNATEAQIMRPSLLPSVRQNRTPLSSIRKGRQIGVAVVRGFDRKVWSRLYPNHKLEAEVTQAKVGAYLSQSGNATTARSRESCQICDEDAKRPPATDLVLVIHGIGQKLSERMDSFHFTHAINGLRREFNVELASESVKGNLKDNGGIMVLPVNWRLTLSFDDDPKSAQAAAENRYNLLDITPESLPAVRSLISDVMLDIPYYMSHHKQKMIEAVVREANRIYRLWCQNNPGFDKFGRVHLVAHSLGSVMAMEILSQQPTRLSEMDLTNATDVSVKQFEFDTTTLFCCGSPSGFFLLLNGANLVPRKGRNKPGMEGEDQGRGVAAGAGTYGCLAVDNLYNICHRNDPIAYLQNACVDSAYANSLEPASIPSATVGVLQRLGNTLRWSSGSHLDAYNTQVAAPRPSVQHMPSTVELETHNFSREEIAEKRMYLLNDNGQIDFFLSSGGGPLEIQYLNMLGAHSSYWLLQDFVKFLVMEIGRRPGRQNTIPALRAVKKREYKRASMT